MSLTAAIADTALKNMRASLPGAQITAHHKRTGRSYSALRARPSTLLNQDLDNLGAPTNVTESLRFVVSELGPDHFKEHDQVIITVDGEVLTRTVIGPPRYDSMRVAVVIDLGEEYA